MKLISTRIITENVQALVDFYSEVTQLEVVQYTPDFAELATASATLAIGSVKTLQLFGGGEIAMAAANQSCIIEFLVTDVEKDYERLKILVEHSLIQKPTLMPWGNKSMLFRDPDGNLVNLFTPVSADAINKFRQKGSD